MNSLLSVGSLMLEVAAPDDRAPLTEILTLERRSDWHSRLALSLAAGELALEHRLGDSLFFATLPLPLLAARNSLRITFSWDGPGRIASVTAENADTGALKTAVFDRPHPIPAEDIAAVAAPAGTCARVAPSVTLIAVSDRIEPVGPMPTILAGTPVATPAGPRPIETLAPGDLISTAGGRLRPVRRLVTREVPALGRFRPIRLRAPYFGLSEDLVIAPVHRVLVDGTDTEYLFGTESALIEARHLGPMIDTAPRRIGPTVRYAQVLLDTHACIDTGGAWTESLFIGSLARQGLRHGRSILAGVPARSLPLHPEVGGPLLKPYEAMVLVSSLCA